MYQTEIHVKGKINSSLSDWFGELHMQDCASDETILRGKLPDMAAVYGVISRLGSLVIPLVSVRCVEESEEESTRPGGRITYPHGYTIHSDSKDSPNGGGVFV
jgi:hypothetical protein